MFKASHPFAFFDYFRTPYEVRPPRQGNGHAGAAAFVRTLTAVARPGQASRSLMWVGADARPAAPSAAGQLGCYRLDNFTFFGHVAPDAAVPAMLPQPGRGWHPAEPIRAADGRRVAAIWRDTDGNVFLPFDPGEVMRLYWSEGYRDIGRSAIAAFGRAAALRGYYLARPAMPRSVQLALRRLFTRVQAASPFPGWPIEDSLHDFYGWLFAVIADLADAPVPFLGLWPDGRSWALVLTHDVETAAGYRDMDLLRAPERARGYRSSWNFVGARYQVDDETVRSLQDDGCEIGVHGLWHDGRDLAGRSHGRAAAGHVGARQPMERCRVPVAGHAPRLGTDAPARIRLRLVLHRHRPVRTAAGWLLHLPALFQPRYGGTPHHSAAGSHPVHHPAARGRGPVAAEGGAHSRPRRHGARAHPPGLRPRPAAG